MKCKNCGNEFEGKFCPMCGTKAEDTQSSVVEPQVVEPQNYQPTVLQSQEPLSPNMSVNTSNSPLHKPFYTKWWFWTIIIVAIIVFAIMGIVNGGTKSSDNATQTTTKDVFSYHNEDYTDEDTTAESTTEEPTTEEPTTEKPTKDPKKVESEYKDDCGTISFDKLSRNPDKYKYNSYKFTGQVIQVQESSWGDSVDLRINVTKKTYEYIDDVSWTDTIYATVTIPEGEDKILEDDIITFWGDCYGEYTYDTVMGSSVTLPRINIRYYELDN